MQQDAFIIPSVSFLRMRFLKDLIGNNPKLGRLQFGLKTFFFGRHSGQVRRSEVGIGMKDIVRFNGPLTT